MSSGLSLLAVKNDVFPFDGADMLQEADVDTFAFRNAHFQNAGDLLGLPIDATTSSTVRQLQEFICSCNSRALIRPAARNRYPSPVHGAPRW